MNKFKNQVLSKMTLHTVLFYYNMFLNEGTEEEPTVFIDEHQRVYDALNLAIKKNTLNKKEAVYMVMIADITTPEIKEKLKDLSFLIFSNELLKLLFKEFPNKNFLPSIPKREIHSIGLTFFKQLLTLRETDKVLFEDKNNIIIHTRWCANEWFEINKKAMCEIDISDDVNIKEEYDKIYKTKRIKNA